MNSRINYSFNNRLEKQIKQRKLIPYIVYPNDRYKRKQWYYSMYDNSIFKVLDVKYNEVGYLDYVYIKSIEDYYSLLVSDLCDEDYLLEKDINNIYKQNIINSTNSYTGAEITYWFFMNDITSFNKKYKDFWRFVDRYSCSKLSDTSRYVLSADIDTNGNYINCKVTKIRNINNISTSDKKQYNEFMKNQKKKDFTRIKNLHEKNIIS